MDGPLRMVVRYYSRLKVESVNEIADARMLVFEFGLNGIDDAKQIAAPHVCAVVFPTSVDPPGNQARHWSHTSPMASRLAI